MSFRIAQPVFDEDGEWNDTLVEAYKRGLMEEFSKSPEAEEFIGQYGDVSWAGLLLDFGAGYLSVTPATMTVHDFCEIIFSIIPRKVSCEAERAEEIVAEFRAFWRFAGRTYGLSQADECLLALGGDAVEQLKDELGDKNNFGMAKSLFMFGNESGFDMTTQDGLDQCILKYNSAISISQGPRLQLPTVEPVKPNLVSSPTKRNADPAKAKRRRKLAQKSRKRNRK